MKITDKKKPVDTIPQGVWEGSRPKKDNGHNSRMTTTTDLQGNGYPVNRKNNRDETR